jgi:putative membrane protein
MNTFTSLPLLQRGAWIAGFFLIGDTAYGRVREVEARSLMHGYAVQALANDSTRPADRSFLQKAIDTGRLQLRLAELGASQASTSEVRSHAEQLKSDNRQLVDAVNSVMQKRGVGTLEPTGRPTEDAYGRLASRTSGEFDREFVRVMAEVHEATINLFEQAAGEGRDPEVRDLAAAQLPMLRAHRNRITELKKMFE